MTITFVFPAIGNSSLRDMPIGGYKIVYEYANRLTIRGHKIYLVHPIYVNVNNPKYYKVRLFKSLLLHKARKTYLPVNWFCLDSKVNVSVIPRIQNRFVPDAEVIIATSWSTAKPVLDLQPKKGYKFYFLQSLETWAGLERDVIETWKYPMKKIVISRWLKDFADNLKVEANYIPNGLNFEEFGVDIELNLRPAKRILMLYHTQEIKGSKYGLDAIYQLKNEFDDIEVCLFGTVPRPDYLQRWIEYYRCPTGKVLRSLYNSASVFIAPSLVEGFPLPPAEAMICGCAVVATDIGGHREYCIDNENSLLVRIKSPDEIYKKVKLLIENSKLRIRIAENAIQAMRTFTWDKSIEMMEEVLRR